MSIQVGSVVEGNVAGIKSFGAFVEIAEGQTGLVHISQVSHTFVNDINDVLKAGDTVQVKVLNVEKGGKISLSIKETQPKPERTEAPAGGQRPRNNNNKAAGNRGGGARKQSGGAAVSVSHRDEHTEPFNNMADQLKEWAKKSGMA